MTNIQDFLEKILKERYGKDVRQSIHDAIQQCYYDGKAGSIDLQARQDIENISRQITDANNVIQSLDDTKLNKTGDSSDNTVTFNSGDSTSPTGWADIVAVASGETHASLFRKFSLAVKNLRYIYNMLGTADISTIGDGTVTGAITGLNNNLITNAFKNKQLIAQENVNLLDGSLSKNEIRIVALGNAINSPIVSNGMALHKIEYTNSEYFTNIVTLFILDTNELWRNSYHKSTNQWVGWENVYAKNNNLKFINTVDSIDGSTFEKNFIYVNLSSNYHELNKTAYFTKPADDSDWLNIPTELQGKIWIGIRFVMRKASHHCFVEIHEMYPVAGRIWSNFYNSGSWTGWKYISPN